MLAYLSRYLKKILILINLLTLAAVMWFLYDNVSRTNTSTPGELENLQQPITPVLFKSKSWDRVIAAIEEKNAPNNMPQDLRDPFAL